jgi:hypothetical protein
MKEKFVKLNQGLPFFAAGLMKQGRNGRISFGPLF